MKMKMACHKTTKIPAKPVKCDDAKCNPFMACASGNFYTVAKSLSGQPFIFQWNEKILPENDNRLAYCLFECWHPPENI